MKKYFNPKPFIAIVLVASVCFYCKKNSMDYKNNDTSVPNYGHTDSTGSFPVTQVNIVQSQFNPSVVSTVKGASISWTNKDRELHTVTSTNGLFDSGDMTEGKNYFIPFPNTGTFTYFCRYHKETGSISIR